MSKIGKNPIAIPDKTDVSVTDGVLSVKGPLGVLEKQLPDAVTVSVENKEVKVSPANQSKLSRSLWGTFGSHIKNMIAGVNKKYEKKLELQGVGYKVELQGKVLKLNVGFSHPVMVAIPDELDVAVEKNTITVLGINKDLVGQFSANVRAVKKPEPYKGKGIRYEGEYVRQKQGKKAAG
ncbi:50S ribosomal protein L6 [Candidatus Kaiserbacteria bacterium CG10_big_fil_rev_8_21_14_0_10_45_20]|uniref:Large ribosomal subunit protein uL6 n=1 Tax=Candidatus Kaiserbacteria bacterium CG10_big_fil_rev_8_21_14_0_10_45_20 TaxID=1974607 RepID=A0A2H0UFI1_9BACT|nr:MAG: 50S ribosomal protein L6 [Candidatus Kaiserbacteria bacterium CG10_big_fil_rev_8_21_14_0_10_45_20]